MDARELDINQYFAALEYADVLRNPKANTPLERAKAEAERLARSKN